MGNKKRALPLAAEGEDLVGGKEGSGREDLQGREGQETDRLPGGGMNIAEVFGLDKIETKPIEWNGRSFDVEFFPAMLETPAFLQGIADATNGRPRGIAEALAAVLGGWGLDWNGDVFPPVLGNLMRLPEPFLLYLAGELVPEETAQAANG